MPKHKKTRKQKIMADQRRETSAPLYSFTPESLPKQAKPEIPSVKPIVSISTASYQYLRADLRKTALFTALIVVLELVFYYFQKGV